MPWYQVTQRLTGTALAAAAQRLVRIRILRLSYAVDAIAHPVPAAIDARRGERVTADHRRQYRGEEPAPFGPKDFSSRTGQAFRITHPPSRRQVKEGEQAVEKKLGVDTQDDQDDGAADHEDASEAAGRTVRHQNARELRMHW